MDQSLRGQTALVTGASSGIGAGIALALGAAGAAVVVNYAGNAAGAERVAAEIQAAGGSARVVRADVSQRGRGRGDVRRHAGDVGAPGHPRRELRRPARRPADRDDARAVEHRAGRQPHRRLPVRAGGGPDHAAAAAGPRALAGDRQDPLHLLGARGHPVGGPRQLRGVQGRPEALHAVGRPGAGASSHPRELHRAGRDPDADQPPGLGDARGAAGACSRSSPTGASACRRTSAGPPSGSPPTPPTTCTARRCSWTAA